MSEYPKINTIWKRDEHGNILEGEYSMPEIEYLANSQWVWTEKVDGTNIRIRWDPELRGKEHEMIRGRTDHAQLPPALLSYLIEFVTKAPMETIFDGPAILYGEGYGQGIQKHGGNYCSTVSFVLFDVRVGNYWLERENVHDIGSKLPCDCVPVVGIGTLHEACARVQVGFDSYWGSKVQPEGLVLRPLVELFDRRGHRMITKIKKTDYARKQ